MNTPTYKEQFDKITRAYIANELEPYDNCACFIGNLLNNDPEWSSGRIRTNFREFSIQKSGIMSAEACIKRQAYGFYTLHEIYEMEANFMSTIEHSASNTEYYNEDGLFHAMESTLEMLKQIHISKGEQVDEIPFTKRQLIPA